MGARTQEETAQWDFWIDRGGTFTDVVARRPDGSYAVGKLLSENPEQYSDAALQGIRNHLGVPTGEPIPTHRIATVKMGTTVGTNALLERKGDATLLIINSGFRDALRIGYQNRAKLFELDVQVPEQLYSRVLEVDGRMDAHGGELVPVDIEAATVGLRAAYEDGFRSCAVCFLHGYRYTAHEKAVAAAARAVGFTQISVSHQVSPLMKLVSRGDTTVVDAYLSPILRRYVDQVASELGGTRLMFMQSSGGLTDARLFQGKDCIVSGPAGGVVGVARTTTSAGFSQVIGFDMGGTSTDTAHYAGEFERAFETEVAGVRMRAPMMDIHTVAAGGSSICSFDGSRFTVGPESAGANPGPACYRRGGPLTVTDCNVLLGKLQPDYFPAVFGPQADQPLDAEVVNEKFADLATATGLPVEEIAAGFLRIAVDNMANAIKKISIQRGFDVSSYVLGCFGGAGGQHACLVADSLNMKKVMIHPFAGVLSAFGMGLADTTAQRIRAVEAALSDQLLASLHPTFDALQSEAEAELLDQDISSSRIQTMRRLHLKYVGSDTAIIVPFGSVDEIVLSFNMYHKAQYGFVDDDRAHIVEAVEVEAIGAGEAVEANLMDASGGGRTLSTMPLLATCTAYMEGEFHSTPVVDRNEMLPGDRLDGPVVIREDTATTCVEPGWQAELTAHGDLLLTRVVEATGRVAAGTTVDPVMLEIFNNLFMSIAEQMGLVLQQTSYSVNIKERLDFSCAVFGQDGELIANAPHMPVHLGSMDESIKAVIRAHENRMSPGDVFVLNAPYNGGTHLPDITVISPVFDEGGLVLFYVASRGHHADIGGITPGKIRSYLNMLLSWNPFVSENSPS